MPLLAGTAANLASAENAGAALTGPISRGDAVTVAGHLKVLPQEFVPAYCALGLATVKLARESGRITESAAAEMTELFTEANKAVIKQMKQNGEPVTMVTAYDYAMAKNVCEAGIEMILVGDSLGNVVLGYNSTVPVTMDEMIHHTKAVMRAAQGSGTMVVGDMPFMSYQASVVDGMYNAARFLKETGCAAVLPLCLNVCPKHWRQRLRKALKRRQPSASAQANTATGRCWYATTF